MATGATKSQFWCSEADSGRDSVFANMKLWIVPFALCCATVALAPSSVSAVTAEVAKKCNALVAQAYPPREAGNPAAGSASGTAQAARDYFRICVEHDGKMDDRDQKEKPIR
jgi:hypothetical protein